MDPENVVVVDITRDEEVEVEVPIDDLPPNQAAAVRERQLQIPRAIVDLYHLCQLIKSYYTHFNVYSRTRKQVGQLVPAMVWRDVYVDYTSQFPNAPFSQVTLKDRLRDALRELKTGTSNEEGLDKGVLQNDDIMRRLRATNSHAQRNVLKMRSDIINGVPPTNSVPLVVDPTKCKEEEKCPDCPPPPAAAHATGTSKPAQASTSLKGVKQGRPQTKSQSLKAQAQGIMMIGEAMKAGHEQGDKLLKAKLQKEKLKNLRTIFKLGGMTDEDFKLRVQEILDDI